MKVNGNELRKLMTNGVFGVLHGSFFVVVSDYIVYEDGGFDCVSSIESDEYLRNGVDKLFANCKSFKQARRKYSDENDMPKVLTIYNRDEILKKNEKEEKKNKEYDEWFKEMRSVLKALDELEADCIKRGLSADEAKRVRGDVVLSGFIGAMADIMLEETAQRTTNKANKKDDSNKADNGDSNDRK